MRRINSPHRQESKPRSSERGSATLELFQERGEMFRDGVRRPHRTQPAAIARFPAAMGFRPGCRDVGIGPTHARVGYDRLGWLAACSHARLTPEHEAPISAQNVCETLKG
jgi:hypothetical protein